MQFKINKSRLSRKIAATLMMWTILPIGAFAAESNETNEDAREYVNMEDMLITAERIPTNKWDTPANVAIITAKEIEDNHYQDLAEALNSVNGVYVASGTLSNAAMMNGTNRVVLLVNGRRLSSPQSYYGYSAQAMMADTRADISPIPTMKMIERIEIIKGGNSALYGSDAVGGVINIITKKGKRNETTLDINKAFGQSHRYGVEISNQGVSNRFGYFFTGAFRESNGGTKGDYARNITDAYNSKGLSLRMDYRFDDRSSLTFDSMYRNYDRYDVVSYEGLYNSFALTYNFKEGTATPGWLRYHNNYSKPSYLGTLRLQAIEYQNGWEVNKNNKLILGMEWQKHQLKFQRYGGISYDGGINRGAIYLQDTMKIGDRWQIVPGVRLDYQETSGSQWSPKIAINYRPDEKTKFYTSWGRVHNAPSQMQLFIKNGYRGNPNLLSESGQAFTIGLERAFNEKTNLSMNYFYGYMDNVIDYTTFTLTENRYREKQHGVEISFNQKLSDKWSYGIGYTHADAELSGSYPSFNWDENSAYKIPTDSLVLGLRYRLGRFRANLNNTTYYHLIYEHFNTLNTKEREICSWWDLNASYDVNDQFTVYTKIQNLGNRRYEKNEEGARLFQRPGRYYMLGATYKF